MQSLGCDFATRCANIFITCLDNIGNCVDRLTSPCQPYKDAGYCETYPDNMKYWCAKTCFNCKLLVKVKISNREENFSY